MRNQKTNTSQPILYDRYSTFRHTIHSSANGDIRIKFSLGLPVNSILKFDQHVPFKEEDNEKEKKLYEIYKCVHENGDSKRMRVKKKKFTLRVSNLRMHKIMGMIPNFRGPLTDGNYSVFCYETNIEYSSDMGIIFERGQR
ncbi:hypothetical protein ACJX0J_022180 [Zea mays]